MNLVNPNGSSPFDVTAAFLSVLDTTEEAVIEEKGEISYASFHVTLGEFFMLIAKLSLISTNNSVSKSVRLLCFSLECLKAVVEKILINDGAILLLLDEHAPLAALGGGDDELEWLYFNAPEFLTEHRKEWNFDMICGLAR